jgi:hypothetical protein
MQARTDRDEIGISDPNSGLGGSRPHEFDEVVHLGVSRFGGGEGFEAPLAGPADPASNISYQAGIITVSPTVVATGVAATDLTGVSTVVTGASTGISSASWNPTISVIVPANYAPGVYSATITHSVA